MSRWDGTVEAGEAGKRSFLYIKRTLYYIGSSEGVPAFSRMRLAELAAEDRNQATLLCSPIHSCSDAQIVCLRSTLCCDRVNTSNDGLALQHGLKLKDAARRSPLHSGILVLDVFSALIGCLTLLWTATPGLPAVPASIISLPFCLCSCNDESHGSRMTAC